MSDNDPIRETDGPVPKREDVIRADLVKRLRTVCAHFSDEEFARLIDSMVQRQLKSEGRKPLA